MSQTQSATHSEPTDSIDPKTVRELANSNRETAWIYQLWLEHYAEDGGESK